MKKVAIFLFVILGITAALPANSQVTYGTVIIEGTPQRVELFPGVYDFFGCAEKDTTDSNSVTACRHAITIDGDVADGILGKNSYQQATLFGPVLDEVNIRNILNYAAKYLAMEEERVEGDLVVAKMRPPKERAGQKMERKRRICSIEQELKEMRSEKKALLEGLEEQLRTRVKQGTIYIYQAELQDRSI